MVHPTVKISIALIVNGVERQLNVAPWTTLLDALRDHLDLTGTKARKRAAITANAVPAPC
jgi:aerobic-type carbon monoxide dehydrogenase small subunit (CoxS/CutS family)